MFSFIIRFFLLFVFAFTANGISLYAGGNNYPQVMFIFDASGSMWAKAGDESKIDAAKKVMNKIVPSLPSEVKVGLAAYGHRRKGDCKDIEILIPPGSDDRKALIDKVNKLSPKGKTPIADTISLVADKLKSFENETTIILVSDGEETCNADPCGVVKKLKDSGIKFILHVVGFAVNDKQKVQLECLAKAGGGKYVGAKDSASLLSALENVKKEVEQKVIKAKSVTKKAAPKFGKIEFLMPKNDYHNTLNTIKIIRKKDKKVVSTIKHPKSGSLHPLPAGEYQIIAGYANSNYHKDSEVSLKEVKIEGGKISKISFGALAFNISDALKKIPVDFVVLQSEDDPNFKIVTTGGNDYYFYKTKPLPAGKYSFLVHYGTFVRPIMNDLFTIASNIVIEEGKTTTINIITGFRIKKPKDTKINRWQLIPKGEEKAALDIKRPWDNDFPVWAIYAVKPGKYDLVVTVEGMNEPMTVAEDMEIKEGEIVNFDTGL